MVPSPDGSMRLVRSETNGNLSGLLPEASKACLELLKCGCKQGCSGRCKCAKVNLPCTSLCQCSGECFKSQDIWTCSPPAPSPYPSRIYHTFHFRVYPISESLEQAKHLLKRGSVHASEIGREQGKIQNKTSFKPEHISCFFFHADVKMYKTSTKHLLIRKRPFKKVLSLIIEFRMYLKFLQKL